MPYNTNYMNNTSIKAALSALLMLPTIAAAQCVNTESGNQSPFAAIHLQPNALNHSQCDSKLAARYSVSSHSVVEKTGNEDLLIDGEQSRLQLDYQATTNSVSWLDSFSITVPLYRHDGGSLDGIIDDWHELTGLDAGDRPNRPQDKLEYRYIRNGNTLVDITEPQSGLGDITVALHKNKFSFAAKLPTGDEAKLTGSGGLELGLAYATALPEAGYSGYSASVGATYIADDKVLKGQNKDMTAALGLVAALAVGTRSNVFIGGSWQTAWYQSDLGPLGSYSGNIGFGAYGETASGYWSVRITEDFPTESAPDFGLSLDYSWKL